MPDLPLSLRYAAWLGTIAAAITASILCGGTAIGMVGAAAGPAMPANASPASLRSVPRIMPVEAATSAAIRTPAPPHRAGPAPAAVRPVPPTGEPAVRPAGPPHMQVVADDIDVIADPVAAARRVGRLGRDDIVDYLALSGRFVLVQRGAVFGWVPGAALREIERRPAA